MIIIDLLIKQCYNDHHSQRNFRNETPLIVAVRMKSARLVGQLLAAGADHTIPTSQGLLPIMRAVKEGRKIVKEFVDAGVPLDSINADGETALTLAIRCGEFVHLLKSHILW